MAELVLAEATHSSPVETDALLVAEAQRRPAAFAALYRRYASPVHRHVYSRVGNRADAEDVTAEVFTEALAALPGYRERGLFPAWLFSIARRKVAAHYRGARPVEAIDAAITAPSPDPDPVTLALEQEARTELTQLMARLDEDQRELLRLRYAAGLTYREIGAVLGKREAAVKMAVHRLLGRLHDEWEGDDAR